jgi:DNA-binding NarL/FixJ family response regulator
MYQIAIVEDNLDFAHYLSKELFLSSEINAITIFESGEAFLKEMQTLSSTNIPQIVLMDISMETDDAGIYATKVFKEKYASSQVIMLTLHEEDEMVFEAFKVGAVGYLLKDEKIDFIIKAIKEVGEGGSLMSAIIARKTIQFFQNNSDATKYSYKTFLEKNGKASKDKILSERELEILTLIGKGYSYQKAADELFISLHTMKTHMNNIFKKLEVSNKIDALRKQNIYSF